MAKEIDDIGWERSRGVSEHFKSVAEMVQADEKEWMQVKGVGKKIAKSVVANLQGR